MKIEKIVLFIFSVLALLAVLIAVYPKDGIAIGKVVLKFPTMQKVLTGSNNPTEPISEDFENEDDTPTDDSVHLASVKQKPEVSLDTLTRDSSVVAAFVQESKKDTLVLPTDSLSLLEWNAIKDTVEYCQSLYKSISKLLSLPDNDIFYFDKMFAKMEAAEKMKKTCRVLHYGDSQIELDRISSELRDYFQNMFGGRGAGLIPLYQSIPNMSVHQTVKGEYQTFAAYGYDERDSIGNYGIMTKSFLIDDSVFLIVKAPKWNDNQLLRSFSSVKILFDDLAGDLNISFIDKKSNIVVAHQNDSIGFGFFEYHLDSLYNEMTVSFNGNAYIYGLMFDGEYGVSVDNIPLRGSSGIVFSLIDDALLKKSYQYADVELVILQFGGNALPAISGENSAQDYAGKVYRQLRHLKRIYPEATYMFIGPSDMAIRKEGEMVSHPYLRRTVECLKDTVLSCGVAYWDLYAMMGGNNSMVRWVQDGLAGDDYIHFNNRGAEKAGKALTNSFATMYDIFTIKQQFDTVKFETIWDVYYRY